MNLAQKIKIMEEEVGHINMLCLQGDCKERAFHYVKGYQCREGIPYVKRIGDRIAILELCTLKIEEYWKK